MLKHFRELVFILFVGTLLLQTFIADKYMESNNAYQFTGFIGGLLSLTFLMMLIVDLKKNKKK